MKKISLLFLTAAALTFSSCEDELNQAPISSGSVPTFYQSATDFSQALNATYNALRNFPDRELTLSEMRSDNIYGVSTQGVRPWEPINNFSTTIATSEFVDEAWSANYAGIFRANVLLDQLGKNGGVLAADVRSRMEGEAKFLRAFFYFNLVQYFGRVPLVDKPLSPQEVATINRTSVDEVYNLIVADLLDAAGTLAPSYTGADVGRATKWAAKGMLARVYLTRSGATYGIDGPGRGTNDYAAALGLLNEIIASGQFQFLPNYADIFSYTNENNKEVLFDIHYSSGGTGLGATYPSILVSNNYFNSVVPNTSGFSTGDELRPASNNLLSSFATGDLRRSQALQVGFTVAASGSTPAITDSRAAYKKYLDVARRGTTRADWSINFIVLRYTDVLLMKAECILKGGGGSQSDADAIMNQVRRRGVANAPAVTNTTYAQLIEERRREFVGEGLRWHDLVRSGNAVTIMNAWIPQDDVSKRMRSPITANDLIYPVPQSELSASGYDYEQNPGY
ncbi:RagB/SusD family nutrient uptake outer membrane protein [Hymenobacter sp. GOD-10R]|uniref:RagB/SusD family nutrient uptake outer membrane protein n=1 Tax=Hymenobacter sp. GOD-10R TaxID=3093922 RepID=UPI002D79C2EB|nr:RagB/SusD family nutrient uptake outer membrane protein [Hymenobacter sp. GOD-10R]WRQ30643.1 RagB/SusD family nutrient uptake outer membrane protein [Hymenobacter sp. GOD-10R]